MIHSFLALMRSIQRHAKAISGHLHVILSDNKAYITFPAFELEVCPSLLFTLKHGILKF